MFDPAIIGILMFPVIVAVLMMGFPVAFTLAGVSLIFAGFGAIAGLVHTEMLSVIPGRIYGIMTNQVYVAIPLFIFMGVVLERSRIAEDLLETMGLLFGHMRGGLGLSVIFVGMLLAASTGVVGATVVTMGLLSLPAMLRAGYDPKLATGVICASGTLGQIIPPSTVLILLADVLQGAYAEAQTAKGNFAPEPVSVVDIFAGAFFPSLVLVGLYASWVIFNAITRKDACPALVKQGEVIEGLGLKVVKVLLPPLALIIAVLGSIIAGLATPTESAAIGSICALALAGWRGALTLDVLRSAMRSTLQISTMIYLILVGATLFSLVFRLYDGDRLVEDFLLNMPGGAFASVLFVMVVIFLLGFVLDFIEIMFLVLPIVAPIIFMYDISPIWFGVLVAVNLQTSFLTPPVGFSLFYLRSVAPPSVTTAHIYKGIIPFVCLQLIGLALMWYFTGLSTWLPQVLFK